MCLVTEFTYIRFNEIAKNKRPRRLALSLGCSNVDSKLWVLPLFSFLFVSAAAESEPVSVTLRKSGSSTLSVLVLNCFAAIQVSVMTLVVGVVAGYQLYQHTALGCKSGSNIFTKTIKVYKTQPWPKKKNALQFSFVPNCKG